MVHKYISTGKRLALALTVAGAVAAPARADVDAVYLQLVERYAHGERAEAVARLSRYTEGYLTRNVQLVASLAQSRGEPPPWLNAGWLRAAVMLHVDRDEWEQPPQTADREHARPCPGTHAKLAARYAGLLAAEDETKGFARRFFLAMAHRCQWVACLGEAQRWSQDGLKLFPRDARLMLAAGSALEEDATLSLDLTTYTADLAPRYRDVVRDNVGRRQRQFELARHWFQEALAADASLTLARLHLGRLLWRLGDLGGAQAALQQVLDETQESGLRYLSHVFLGRVHEDAKRLEPAVAEYRMALAEEPKAQAAAIALANALRLGGAADEARLLVGRALAQSGTRGGHDSFWEYITGDAIGVEEEFAGLRKETLQ